MSPPGPCEVGRLLCGDSGDPGPGAATAIDGQRGGPGPRTNEGDFTDDGDCLCGVDGAPHSGVVRWSLAVRGVGEDPCGFCGTEDCRDGAVGAPGPLGGSGSSQRLDPLEERIGDGPREECIDGVGNESSLLEDDDPKPSFPVEDARGVVEDFGGWEGAPSPGPLPSIRRASISRRAACFVAISMALQRSVSGL